MDAVSLEASYFNFYKHMNDQLRAEYVIYMYVTYNHIYSSNQLRLPK